MTGQQSQQLCRGDISFEIDPATRSSICYPTTKASLAKAGTLSGVDQPLLDE